MGWPGSVALVAAVFFASSVASAQTLEWNDALARARLHAPGAMTAVQSLRAARADATGAGRWLRSNPVVRFGADHEIDDEPSYSFGGGIEQTFDIAGLAHARGRQSAAAVRVAERSAETTTLDALREAADAFIALDQAQRVVEIWTLLGGMYDRLASAARQSEAAAVTSRQQTLLTMIEQSAIAGDLDAATSERARARSVLAVLVGSSNAAELAVTSSDVLPAPDARTAETLVSLALANRPEIPALRAQLEEAQQRAGVAALVLVPSPTLFLGVRRERAVIDPDEVRPNAAGVLGTSGSDHRSVMLAADLSFSLPLFDRGQAERARAAADATTARENLVIAERRVRAEVVSALTTSASSWSAYYRWVAMGPALDEAAALATRGYQSGQIGIFETLVALERVARGRIALVRSRADYWRARVGLARALGELA